MRSMSMSCADGTLKSNRGIYHEITRLQQAGECSALATPVRLSGSVPCVSESRLLMREDGSILGTVGGGLLEAEVLRNAPGVIESDEPLLLEFNLTQDEASKAGMICGGACTVLIEPIQPDRATEVYAAAAQSETDGSRLVLITVLADQYHKLALLPDGVLVGSTGDADIDSAVCAMAQQTGEEPDVREEPFPVILQPMCPPPSVYIFGGGHVAVPVEHFARMVGFRTTVIDDRGEFADVRRFPHADQVLTATVDEAFDSLPIGEGAYVVSITRGHELDEEVVSQALKTDAKYIGMIGSKRKVEAIRQRLRNRGFGETDLARLHAPIGIDIGAETIEEIALSIVAELVAVRRGVTP
jgi:xanthine dehydrogenase accessory factor